MSNLIEMISYIWKVVDLPRDNFKQHEYESTIFSYYDNVMILC